MVGELGVQPKTMLSFFNLISDKYFHIQVNASKEVCPDKRIYAWSWLEDGLFGRYFTNALPSHICLMEDQPYNYK